jgi:hypothetical protein
MSICALLKVVQTSRRSAPAMVNALNGRPGRGRYSARSSSSLAPPGKTVDRVRNMSAYREPCPCCR